MRENDLIELDIIDNGMNFEGIARHNDKVVFVPDTIKGEKVLAKVAADVLKVEKIGLLDNFFDLGGDSMKALELISKLETEGYFVDTKTIFESNTVRDLAEKLTESEIAEETFAFDKTIKMDARILFTNDTIMGTYIENYFWYDSLKREGLDV